MGDEEQVSRPLDWTPFVLFLVFGTLQVWAPGSTPPNSTDVREGRTSTRCRRGTRLNQSAAYLRRDGRSARVEATADATADE